MQYHILPSLFSYQSISLSIYLRNSLSTYLLIYNYTINLFIFIFLYLWVYGVLIYMKLLSTPFCNFSFFLKVSNIVDIFSNQQPYSTSYFFPLQNIPLYEWRFRLFQVLLQRTSLDIYLCDRFREL